MSAGSGKYVLALDLGGSKISGAIVDSNLAILEYQSVPSRTNIQGIADPHLAITKGFIADLCDRARAQGIEISHGGVGFPEYVNLQGFITTKDNIDWDVQPQGDFADLTGFGWIVESDVRCAGVAEAIRGAGTGEDNFVYLTISSGISHTHFLGSQAVTGLHGEAIGFGAKELELEGSTWILENYCSGLGIARRYAQLTGSHSLDAKALMERFESDSVAREVITSACQVIGSEMAALAAELGTSHLVIGGGLWLGSERYRALAMESFSEKCRQLQHPAAIQNAQVEHGGVIGAAIYALADVRSRRT